MKRIIVDLDGTITHDEPDVAYKDKRPQKAVVEQLRNYRANGFTIVIATARNMRTYNGNVGLLNVHTLPIIIEWLVEHQVPYDEILVGKPWCGYSGFYVDDKAIRPQEFIDMTYGEIANMLNLDQVDD